MEEACECEERDHSGDFVQDEECRHVGYRSGEKRCRVAMEEAGEAGVEFLEAWTRCRGGWLS